MSDRVARLAELRRKRNPVNSVQLGNAVTKDHAQASATGSAGPEDGAVAEASVTSESTNAGIDLKKSEASNQEAKVHPSNEQKPSKLTQQVGEAKAGESNMPEPEQVPHSVHTADQEASENAPALTYNSDLKEDLKMYLEKAHKDTENAFNRYLHQKYRESLSQ